MSTNWISLSQSAGTGNQQVTVAADVNTSIEQRTLRLVIAAGDQTKYVFIQQAGAPIRIVRIYFNAASDVVVPYTGGTASYNQSRFMVMAEYNDGATRQIGDVTITGTSTTISTVNTGITTQLVSQLSATATYSGSSATTVLTASTIIDVMQQPAPETNRITYSASTPIVFTNDAVNNFGANIIASGYNNGSGAYIFDEPVERFYGNASCMITPATKGALTGIDVPSSLINLGQNVFNGCSALTTVNGLEYTENVYLPPENAGNGAFYNCTSLTHCGLPHSYTYWSGGAIKADVFYGCSSLTTIIYNGTMAEWNAISKNSNWRRNSAVRYVQCTDGTIDLDPPQYATITYYAPAQLTISSAATTPSITSHTFSNGVGTIKASGDITEINRSGFTNCSGMTSIELPDSLEAIHSYAFTSAMSLTTITIPDSVTVLGDSVFWRCTGLTSVNIPTGITTINQSTFSTCSSLTGITVPNGVTKISSYAFYKCYSLAQITIPSSVNEISGNAFGQCSSLITINYSGTKAQWNALTKSSSWRQGSSIRYVQCSDGTIDLDQLPNNAIRYYAPGKLTISSAATTPSITSHTFSNGVGTVLSSGDITEINTSGFTYCSGMTGIELPDSVTTIGDYAFYFCKGLTEIALPNLTTIGKNAFQSCTGLTEITIPSGVTTISERAFNYCKGLTGLTLSNVSIIGYRAFGNCENLPVLTIPSSVTKIEQYAFADCLDLSTINYNGTMAQWSNVIKISNWQINVPATVAHCTDGDAPLYP